MKTIFVVITRGLLVRNILRGKTLEVLKQQKNLRIVILIQNIYNAEIPEYLIQELGAENVIIEFMPNVPKNKLQRIFYTLTNYLVFSESSKFYIAERLELSKRISNFRFSLLSLVYWPLSKLSFLKKAVRRVELLIYNNKGVASIFDKYKPDLIFSTAILSGLDYDAIKEAQKRSIKTISMPKRWDNLSRILFRVEPDLFLVQNNNMKEETVKYQAISPKKIEIVGFPQFDIYKDDVLVSKEAFCAKRNLDPSLPILFLGSEGLWSVGDEKVFEDVVLSRESGAIIPCNIVIRPHFSTAHQNKYEKFRSYKYIYIDNNFRKSKFFGDRWDPTREDQVDLTNLLYHCDALITFASTLTLDSACFNKPVIAPAYGINFKDGKDISETIYKKGYYKQVVETGAPILVYSKEELAAAINKLIKDPDMRQKEVEVLKKNMCGMLDGKSGERIADSILKYVNK